MKREQFGASGEVIASSSHLEEKFQECSKRKGFGANVATLGVDLRTRTKQLGGKVKARRDTCDVCISLKRKERVVQER